MNILAFDTSSPACSVAVCFVDRKTGELQTFAAHELAPMQHTALVLPMIESLLASAGITLAELNAIAFGCGPGSFTGIRIAASLAQGLAFANNLPVIPVSSLAASAQAAYLEHGWSKQIVAVDARMGQMYFAVYHVENNIISPVIAEQLLTPDAIPAVTGEGWAAIGDAWGVYHKELLEGTGQEPLQVEIDRVPSAEAVLCIAKERFSKGDWVVASAALPVYLR